MTNAASAERYARASKDNLYVERDTTDEINQFTAPLRAPLCEKLHFIAECAIRSYVRLFNVVTLAELEQLYEFSSQFDFYRVTLLLFLFTCSLVPLLALSFRN